MSLDESDNRIIKLLRSNPRMSYTEIADTIGMSRITVANRMKRMLDENLLDLRAEINLKNRNVKLALLGLEVVSADKWDECLAKLGSLPCVVMGFKSLGRSNLRVLIYGESDEVLERSIDMFRYYDCVNFIEVEVLGKTLMGNINLNI